MVIVSLLRLADSARTSCVSTLPSAPASAAELRKQSLQDLQRVCGKQPCMRSLRCLYGAGARDPSFCTSRTAASNGSEASGSCVSFVGAGFARTPSHSLAWSLLVSLDRWSNGFLRSQSSQQAREVLTDSEARQRLGAGVRPSHC